MDQAKARVEALRRYGVLDSAASVGLDKVVRLAQFIAGSRFAAIHLLDETSQHRIARAGPVPSVRTPLHDSMCVRVVELERPLYVADATEHYEFAGNPFTTGEDPVRFYAATPLRDEAGVTFGTLCVFDHDRIELDEERLGLLDDLAEHVRDHLELHSRVRQLGHSATHDALTGLPNRTLLSDRLTHAMTRRGRRPGAPALALIDLDGFKAVNDGLGHQAGDEVLVAVAARLLAAVREEDTVARLGGDEFVVLYEQLPVDGAERTTGMLRERLARAFEEPLLAGGQHVRVAASIGLVQSRPDELGYELLGRADQTMYQQKAERHRGPGRR